MGHCFTSMFHVLVLYPTLLNLSFYNFVAFSQMATESCKGLNIADSPTLRSLTTLTLTRIFKTQTFPPLYYQILPLISLNSTNQEHQNYLNHALKLELAMCDTEHTNPSNFGVL